MADLDFGPPKDRRRLPNPIRTRGRTPGERFLRAVLLIAVFVGVAVLFNRHFERSMERIEAGKAVSDQTGRLTAEDKRFARDFGRALKERYGLDFRLRAGPGAASPPADLAVRTLYVGLDPGAGEATLFLPPLLGRAIGDDTERELTDRLRAAASTDAWPETLASVLTDLWLRLKQVETEEADRERERSVAPSSPDRPTNDDARNDANRRDDGARAPFPEAKPESGASVERTGQDAPGQAALDGQESGRQDDENRGR